MYTRMQTPLWTRKLIGMRRHDLQASASPSRSLGVARRFWIITTARSRVHFCKLRSRWRNTVTTWQDLGFHNCPERLKVELRRLLQLYPPSQKGLTPSCSMKLDFMFYVTTWVLPVGFLLQGGSEYTQVGQIFSVTPQNRRRG